MAQEDVPLSHLPSPAPVLHRAKNCSLTTFEGQARLNPEESSRRVDPHPAPSPSTQIQSATRIYPSHDLHPAVESLLPPAAPHLPTRPLPNSSNEPPSEPCVAINKAVGHRSHVLRPSTGEYRGGSPHDYQTDDADDRVDTLDAHTLYFPGHKLTLGNRGEEYSILRKLGVGGSGRVYLARNLRNRANVAIKVQARKDTESYSRDSIKDELEVLEKASEERAPFLVHLLCDWCDIQAIYFVMEAYSTDLHSWMAQEQTGFLFGTYIAELVHAVRWLHSKGYVHLDIKPPNVLIASSGHLALSDFGLATREEQCRGLSGTTGYQAPEVIDPMLFGKRQYTALADVWSLGILILEVYFVRPAEVYVEIGRHTQAYTQLKTLTSDPRSWPGMIHLRNRNRHLYALLSNMLVRNPDERWSSSQLISHPYFRRVDWNRLCDRPPLAHRPKRVSPVPTAAATPGPSLAP